MMFVTGGSRGIGRAIVLEAIGQGQQVAFSYVSSESGAAEVIREAARIEPNACCRAYRLDVRNPTDVAHTVTRVLLEVGEVSSVILNAGITCNELAVSTSDELWKDVLDINLNGAFWVAREFLRAMLARGKGSLVFIGSIAQEGMTGAAAYAASKAGLIGLSGTLAKEYGRKGIRSNLIVAGPFETELSRQVSEAHRAFTRELSPLGRAGATDELAAAVLFLASDQSSFVNGATLNVSGGIDWLP